MLRDDWRLCALADLCIIGRISQQTHDVLCQAKIRMRVVVETEQTTDITLAGFVRFFSFIFIGYRLSA